MNNESLIRQLSTLVGISDAFRDHRDQPRAISADTLAAILAARGFDPEDEAGLRVAIEELSNAAGEFRAPAVVVWREGASKTIKLQLARSSISNSLHWQLRTEQGQQLSGEFLPQEQPVDQQSKFAACELKIDEHVEHGYHWLTIFDRNRVDGNRVDGNSVDANEADANKADNAEQHRVRIIMAPAAAYEGDVGTSREWGVSLQLYCLKSTRNWGIGDFTDLADLAHAMGTADADFLGINPLHSLYPSNPEHASPYSPSSRALINYLYIDVEAVSEFAHCETAQAKVASEYFQKRIDSLRAASHVDYSGVAFLKLVILRHLYDNFLTEELNNGTGRSRRFLKFVEEGGEALEQTCLFYALYADNRKASRNGGWRSWPKALQNPDSNAVAAFAETHQDTIHFYMYLQWLADEQLQSAHAAALNAGMRTGLYRDLAVGIDADGADMWRNQKLYCAGASAGAPPDAMAMQGQDWGLPPMDPRMMQAESYETFITDLRANMRHCGALRLDHAMQLMRLWWTPSGHPSSEGAYVLYPLQELLGIVALESHRNRCRIIGEDLGVVPAEIREALPREKIWSYKVMLFEKDREGRMMRPADYASHAMATLTTHDLPTLPGYWRGTDLLLREEFGLFPTTESKEQSWQERINDRQAIVDALKREGLYPETLPDEANKIDDLPSELLLAMEQFLAGSTSSMVCVQMEDWMGVVDPVNVPGTSHEYPNWRRRLPENFENLIADGRVERHAAVLDRDAAAHVLHTEEETTEISAP